MTGQPRKSAIDRDYLTRPEFEAFERSVSSNFQSINETLQVLGRKVDMIATRGTDWRAIVSALGVLATIISIIGGVIAWGLLEKMGSIETRLDRHSNQPAHVQTVSDVATLYERVRSLEAELGRVREEQGRRTGRVYREEQK